MRARLAFALALALGVALGDQTTPAPKAPAEAKKATLKKKSSGVSSTSAKKAPAKKTTVRPSSRTSKTKKAAAPRGQQRPTPERYKEIEQALADRGYLLEEPSGKWSPAAVEALRSFQSDHDLPPTGRIDAVSLMQLGLGAKQ